MNPHVCLSRCACAKSAPVVEPYYPRARDEMSDDTDAELDALRADADEAKRRMMDALGDLAVARLRVGELERENAQLRGGLSPRSAAQFREFVSACIALTLRQMIGDPESQPIQTEAARKALKILKAAEAERKAALP